jgi:exosortase D (VPLPA-CTERM-specific)
MVADTETLGLAMAGRADRPPGRVFRWRPLPAALVGLVLLILAVAFRDSLGFLWAIWMDHPEYSHGPLIPLIVAFLIWQRHDRLQALDFEGSWWGPATVALAGAVSLVGSVGAVAQLQEYAFVVALAGVALSVTGWPAMRLLGAPLAMLLLMIPLPTFVLHNLSAELQLLSSSIGVGVIRLVGISVFLEGNVIDLGSYRLQVVEACDGLRYLFPLMALGLLVAYFYKGPFWKRSAVFLSSIPITVLMNSLRIGSIGVLVEHWGAGMAEGFLHEFQGWMVFMLSALLLVGFAALLNRVGASRGPWRRVFGLDLPAPVAAGATIRPRPLPRSFIAAGAVAFAILAVSTAAPGRVESPPARTPFAAFPARVGPWTVQRQVMDSEVREWLLLDDYIQANLVRPGLRPVNFYVSYYASQRDRQVVHSPRACIPGGGWHIDERTEVAIPGTALRASRMLISNGSARQLVYYWFDQRGRNLTGELSVKWFLFVDALTRQRTDGAMVRLITDLPAGGSVADADARIAEAAREVAPLMAVYVPS